MSAEILFGVSTAVITIALLVLTYSWKTLNEMIASLPEGKRRVDFKLKNITDQRHKNKAELVFFQCFGCISFILSIALAIISILGVSSSLLGYHFGFYQQQNYDAGRVSLFISVFLLVMGFFYVSLSYCVRLLAVLNGRSDPLSTPISALPEISEQRIAEINLFDKQYFITFSIFFLILFILFSWNYFAQWVDAIIAILVSGLYFFIVRANHRRKLKRLSFLKNQPQLPHVNNDLPKVP
jgi:hypothetical protein